MAKPATTKPVVMTPVEDPIGARCVDFLCNKAKKWAWVECRRDPEDDSGWRRLTAEDPVWFDTEQDAHADAFLAVAWLAEAWDGWSRAQ